MCTSFCETISPYNFLQGLLACPGKPNVSWGASFWYIIYIWYSMSSWSSLRCSAGRLVSFEIHTLPFLGFQEILRWLTCDQVTGTAVLSASSPQWPELPSLTFPPIPQMTNPTYVTPSRLSTSQVSCLESILGFTEQREEESRLVPCNKRSIKRKYHSGGKR